MHGGGRLQRARGCLVSAAVSLRLSCPVCSRPVRITKHGKYPTHGTRPVGDGSTSTSCIASRSPISWSRSELAAYLEREAETADRFAVRFPAHETFYRASATRHRAAAARLRLP